MPTRMCVCVLSCVPLVVTPWTVVYQASLSMGFSRQEYWSGLPFPSPGDHPDPGIEPRSPALQADTLPSEPPENPTIKKAECQIIDAFELWCWRRLLRVLWIARRSNQCILKEISKGEVLSVTCKENRMVGFWASSMSQDMVSKSLSETLKLYSASQISWGPCYKADYDPGSLGTRTQLDLGCVLSFPQWVPMQGWCWWSSDHTWSSKHLHTTWQHLHLTCE